MNEDNYKTMKQMVKNIGEWLNCPDDNIEGIIGMHWSHFHKLLLSLEEEDKLRFNGLLPDLEEE